MKRYYDVEPLQVAEVLGYKPYPEFHVDDKSTYCRLRADAEQYYSELPAINGYPCWIQEAGMVRIIPSLMSA